MLAFLGKNLNYKSQSINQSPLLPNPRRPHPSSTTHATRCLSSTSVILCDLEFLFTAHFKRDLLKEILLELQSKLENNTVITEDVSEESPLR